MLKIKYNYEISNISFIKVGGKVKLYIETDEIEIIKKIIKITKKIKYIGNTSNMFFSFNYSDYIYIKFINKTITINKNYLILGSSVNLMFLSGHIIEKEISGFEKLGGIPGTIGGSIKNNASCFNQCISDNLIELLCLNIEGDIVNILKNNIDFEYHKSSIDDFTLIIEAKFKINKCIKSQLVRNIGYVKNIRIKTQPYNIITLGSTFRKVDNICLPCLLDYLNIKGKKKNVTFFSFKHVNFLEIGKKEKFSSIIYLIEEVNQLLYNKLGYYIDLEIEQIRGKYG